MKVPQETQNKIDEFLLKISVFFVWLLFFIVGHQYGARYFDKNITVVVAVAFGFLGLLIGITLCSYILRG